MSDSAIIALGLVQVAAGLVKGWTLRSIKARRERLERDLEWIEKGWRIGS